MASLNKVFLIGNLTRDPEVRHTPKGTAVGDLGLAVTTTFRNADGGDREEVCFLDIVVWGRQAETCRDYLSKGSPVCIEGRLQLDQWEAQDGTKKSKIRVRADRVQFLSRGSSGGSGGGGGGRSQQSRSSQSTNPSEGQPPESDHHSENPPDDDIPF